MTDQPIEEQATRMRERYREMVIDWADSRDEPSEANRNFRRLHAYYKEIRGTEAGREAIVALLGDDCDPLRVMAATHSLAWEPDTASLVLEALQDGENHLYSVDAEYTLKAFRQEKLDLNW